MKTRVLDSNIRRTCRDLMAAGGRVTGRSLRRALRDRYGAAGKTERVFRIWREETTIIPPPPPPPLPVDVVELQGRLIAAEEEAAKQRASAELAVLREESHQRMWAMEIDRLRQALHAQSKYAAENRALQDQVLRLHVELRDIKRLHASLCAEHGGTGGGVPDIE